MREREREDSDSPSNVKMKYCGLWPNLMEFRPLDICKMVILRCHEYYATKCDIKSAIKSQRTLFSHTQTRKWTKSADERANDDAKNLILSLSKEISRLRVKMENRTIKTGVIFHAENVRKMCWQTLISCSRFRSV